MGLVLLTCLAGGTLGGATSGYAQQVPSYPTDDYFRARAVYRDGDWETAAKAFRAAGRQGLTTLVGRWIDSICYHAMVGECLYQAGSRQEALEQFDAALKLYLNHPDWLLRVVYPPQPPEVVRRSTYRPATWGTSSRASAMAQLPERMQINLGAGIARQALEQKSVLMQSRLIASYPGEIARCLTLALRRRREILGPLAESDPLTPQLLQALSARPAPPNHWTQTWVSTALGLVYASSSQTAQGVTELQHGIQIGGQFDHLLTPTTLLELGKLAAEQEQWPVAAGYFLEASLSGAQWEQPEIIEEALRLGALVHLASGQPGLYPPLEAAAVWAQKESRWLEASLAVAAAEQLALAGNGKLALTTLESARRAGPRRGFPGDLGARWNYTLALVQAQAGNATASQTALETALTLQGRNSSRLFQLGIADRAYLAGALGAREAARHYEFYLRDPTPADWVLQPLDALTFISLPYPPAMERWLRLAAERNEPGRMLEITDLIRRRRFHTTLARGGRVLALRWLSSAPERLLSPTAVQQRQRLLASFPPLAEVTRQVADLDLQLAGLPLLPDGEQAAQQAELLKRWSELGEVEEQLLQELALRRVPAELVFPPARSAAEIQQGLRPRQLVLAYLFVGKSLLGFAVTRDQVRHWQLADATPLHKQLATLLRQWGLTDRHAVLSGELLGDTSWWGPVSELRSQLLGGIEIDWNQYDEVIVVPDRFLWYLPFEALPAEASAGEALPEEARPGTPVRLRQLLIDRVRVRYAPTAALAGADAGLQRPGMRAAVWAGAANAPGDPEAVADAVRRLQQVAPAVSLLPPQLGATQLWQARLAERLIVFAELEPQGSAYAWPLLPQAGGDSLTLQGLQRAPWGAPDQVLLPSLHTAAENSLRQGGNGDELFLTACSLLASGSRTLVLSRWPTGGHSMYELLREFVQETPPREASDAWQRSVYLRMQSELDVMAEPRVKILPTDRAVRAAHPFFWAGMLLVDTPERDPPAGNER